MDTQDATCTSCGILFLYLPPNSTCGRCKLKLTSPSNEHLIIDGKPQCGRCGGVFLHMDTVDCDRCRKKMEASTKAERDAADRCPQCAGCGCTYVFMTGEHCGRCRAKVNSAQFDNVTAPSQRKESHSVVGSANVQSLGTHAQNFAKQATGVRLKQPKSTDIKSAADVKTKTKQLREQVNLPTVVIDTSLWEQTMKGPKKIPGCTATMQFAGDTIVDIVCDRTLDELRKLYGELPDSSRERRHEIRSADFVRSHTSYHTPRPGKTAVGDIVNVSEFALMSILDFTTRWQNRQQSLGVPTKSGDKKVLPLNICVAAVDDEPEQVSEGSDSDDVMFVGMSSTVKPSQQSAAVKRKAAPTASTVRREASVLPSTKRFTSSTYQSIARSFAETVSFVPVSVMLETCVMNEAEGELLITRNPTPQVVGVAAHWQKETLHSGKAKNGFIGSGGSKYCFKITYKNKTFAATQYSPLGCGDKAQWATEEDQRRDLLNELKLFTLGSHFTGLYNEALKGANAGKDIPNISFSSQEAFLASVCESVIIHGTETASLRSNVLMPDSSASSQPKAPLFFRTFLATPYYSEDKGYKFRKFSGTEEAGTGMDIYGTVIDAFAHFVHNVSEGQYVFVDLQGFVNQDLNVIILIDPQAHSRIKFGTGYWDKGRSAINSFQEQHSCNRLCRKLKLDSPSPKSTSAVNTSQPNAANNQMKRKLPNRNTKSGRDAAAQIMQSATDRMITELTSDDEEKGGRIKLKKRRKYSLSEMLNPIE